ncbi:uncharacterized protein HD556DRAFT_1308831 [Suillus plorans]|uniref:Dienelactone hydrolase domain-containing protein n=1 Tax=Suillus plorans TaxID=116603 RepID=A0A9P7ANH0_9AGAM|nr:uncharacterized protein HD556DRAFT_1308831 [Suillus plorans]KAG1793106.1 hypothetical protein HD556DRAFT_1308831 [Suillus plorans]
MDFCNGCIQGVRHGEHLVASLGTLKTIAGVTCYVATPTVDYAKDKVILLLPDGFGMTINAQGYKPHNSSSLMTLSETASRFAQTIVVAIDYFNGDGIPGDRLFKVKDNLKSLDFWGWQAATVKATRPSLDKVIAALKEEGVTKFGATGHCFGCRHTFDLAFDNIIQCTVVSHISLLNLPDDLETYFSRSAAPLLIDSCEHDRLFCAEAQTKADAIFGDGKFAPGYRSECFPRCTHGFTVLGDLSNPLVKAGKQGSSLASVEFFLEHL